MCIKDFIITIKFETSIARYLLFYQSILSISLSLSLFLILPPSLSLSFTSRSSIFQIVPSLFFPPTLNLSLHLHVYDPLSLSLSSPISLTPSHNFNLSLNLFRSSE